MSDIHQILSDPNQTADPPAEKRSAPPEDLQQVIPRKRTTRVNEKCLFCGGAPEPCFQYRSKDKHWTAWHDDCGDSLCSVLSLPYIPFRDTFAYGPYCSPCALILRDLHFAVKQVAALEKKIGIMKNIVTQMIAAHHKRVQKTTNFAETLTGSDTKVFCSTKPKNLRYRARMLEMITSRLAESVAVHKFDQKAELRACSDVDDDISESNLDFCPSIDEAVVKSEASIEELSLSSSKALAVEKFELSEPELQDSEPKRRSSSSSATRTRLSQNPGKTRNALPRNCKKRRRQIDLEGPDSESECEENQEPEFILPDIIDKGIAIAEAESQEEKSTPSVMSEALPKEKKVKKRKLVKKSKYKKTCTAKRKDPSQVPCDLCPYVAASQRAWDDHNRAAHPERRFECEVCGTGFRMLATLQAHVRNVHGGLRFAHYCDTCKKGFDNEAELHDHEGLHISETPFTCSECQAVFTNSNDLERHVRRHENPFKCVQCFRSFSTAADLKLHMRHHERRVQCDVCGLPCHSEARLKAHLQVHSSVKEFQCDLCPLSYKYKKGLIVHMRIHTGERPFACKICDRAFYSTGHLKRHEEIHSGTRTYVCQTCGKSFMAQNNLKQHERCVHRIGKQLKKRAPRRKVKARQEAEPGVETGTGDGLEREREVLQGEITEVVVGHHSK